MYLLDKTKEALRESKPYPGMKVRKDECVNHVAKRMGKGLRTLVDTKRKQGITLGGNGKGKLTEKKMVRLQKYYKKAILSNDTVDGMNKAIWATYKHCISTDKDPQHADCPPGEKSYCFYQRAIAAKTKEDEMPRHTETSQKTKLSAFVGEHVKSVYERLTDSELLKGCLERKTQNVNESIHAVIWKLCPKHWFVQRQRFEIGVALGVAEYNMGSKGTQLFFDKLGLKKNSETERLCVKRDYLRVRKAEYAVTERVKKARVKVRNARVEIERQIEIQEGGPQYLK